MLILVFSVVCQAHEPQIVFTPSGFQQELLVRQNLELWTQGVGDWQLKFQAPLGLGFFPRGVEDPVAVQKITGSGSALTEFALDLYFDLTASQGGIEKFAVEVRLEGAQGILGLFHQDEYWILPLNSGLVSVERGQDTIFLTSGEWFLIQADDQIFLGEERIQPRMLTLNALSFKEDFRENLEMWWEPVLDLEAGDRTTVVLHLQGPLPGGHLVLQAHPSLQLEPEWILEPGGIGLKASYDGEDLLLDLPNLPRGEYTLRGSLLTFLPPKGQRVNVTASYGQQEATLNLVLKRTWFDFDQIQAIQFKGFSQLLLPDGSKRSVADGGEQAIKAEGLEVIIPLEQPERPLWIGTPLVETELWVLEGNQMPEEFFLPILLYDGGWDWRLVSKSGPWFMDLNSRRQIVEGRFGSVQLQAKEGRVKLWQGADQVHQAGKWWWWQNNEVRRGIWQEGNWMYSLELPRVEGQSPSFGLSYRDEHWRWYLEPGDLILNHRTPSLAWGLRWRSKALWLEVPSRQLGFEVKPKGFKVAYKPSLGPSYVLRLEGAHVGLDIRGNLWEAHLQTSGGALRYKLPKARGPWRSLTLASAQFKNGLVLGELEQRVGYVIAPNCTAFLFGSIQGSSLLTSDHHRLSYNYGVGLVYTPIPQLLTEFTWQKEGGWEVRGGLVLPFVGRNTGSHSE